MARRLATHLEEIVAGHARLARHAGRDDDHIGALQRLTQLVLACDSRVAWLSGLSQQCE